MEVDGAWPWKVIWSDEAHFYLDRAVNSQKCRMRGHFFFETFTPQGPKKGSDMSARYSELLQQQVIPALQERQCLQTTIVMQYGATSHIGRQVKVLLSANCAEIRTLPNSKGSIIRHVAEIPRELLRTTIENTIMRFQQVIDANGEHTEHIL
ncbi:uncharacterized protein TNCV_2964571 [Trichonephila clavipes]|nr:uncharacterized protein TNCV_2964571 [Trichonephila clavipes]